MKRTILLFLMSVSFAGSVLAQTANLVLFAEQGERFTVVLNGLRINDQPGTNVKVTDLNTTNYKLKVVFDDPNIPDMDKNVFVELGSEVTYNIKKNNKGEYVLRIQSETPISQAPPVQSGQTQYVITQVPPNDGVVIRGNVNGTTTTTTTTTTTVGTPNTVGANVNVGGVNMNVTINDGSGTYMGSTTTTTYSETTTTTTSGNNTVVTSNSGCMYPMGSTDFRSAKSSISSKSFEDDKLTVSRQIIDANCLSTDQVKEIMALFSFEETKLTFAKYAYLKTTDYNNYYKLNDAFTYSSSIDELNAYIQANKR